jgi:hypothetical protein
VRNGKVIRTERPGSWQTRIVLADRDDLASLALASPSGRRFVYYPVRVTCESVAQAWSSPVWIQD